MSRAQSPREEGHAAGQRNGKKIAERDARIAAFGAIRRAAEIARMNDCHCGYCPIAHRAKLIRRAIRAAIGSDKA